MAKSLIFAEREQLLLSSLRHQLASRWTASSSKAREYIRHTINHLRSIRSAQAAYNAGLSQAERDHQFDYHPTSADLKQIRSMLRDRSWRTNHGQAICATADTSAAH